MRHDAALRFYGTIGAVLACGTALVRPVEPAATNAPGDQMLMTDDFGKLVVVPTNAMSSQFRPPSGISITNQIPSPTPGTPIPEPVQEREQNQRAGQDELRFFPPFPPPLAPYLASVDQFGNTALKPGALFPWAPNDVLPQRVKYWASEVGLRYSLQQTVTYVNMTDVMQGDNTLAYYTLAFAAKWAVYNDPPSATAGWLSTQIKVKTGLDDSGNTQSAKSNLGTITDPTGLWSGFNGIAVQELAWQQSFRDGELVFLGGVLNQANYLDVNTYANNGRSQFINSALINSLVMPLPAYNFGVNLQWQFDDLWYVMGCASAGTASGGEAPWTGFSFDHWSAAWELGYMPKNVLGLGPGIYRIQPFAARVGDALEPGICFNAQQKLGEHTPIGWYGRFGFGGESVTAGAAAQIGTGFAIRGPLAQLGLAPWRSNDGAGIGFLWSQPSASSATVVHENEFGLEATYVLQLTPMAKLQSDFQVVWDPAYNPGASQAFIFQIQLALAW
jgi:porin